jgi:Spy/CpxP family protein refolding chaperone
MMNAMRKSKLFLSASLTVLAVGLSLATASNPASAQDFGHSGFGHSGSGHGGYGGRGFGGHGAYGGRRFGGHGGYGGHHG